MNGTTEGPAVPEPGQRRITSLSRRTAADAAAPSARLSRAVREQQEAAPVPVPEPSAGPAEDPAPGRRPTVAVNARVDAALRDRARTAFLATQLTESRTFSEFVERALLDRVLALEAQYNEGRPWHPTSRALKPGPP